MLINTDQQKNLFSYSKWQDDEGTLTPLNQFSRTLLMKQII